MNMKRLEHFYLQKKWTMSKCSILTLLLFLFSQGVYAQKEAYNWYFGRHVGMTWNTTQTISNGGKTLTNMPTPLSPSAMSWQLEGVFCMSDHEGELLFYSDGMYVWNKNHQLFSNGSGLLGHWSSAQSGTVIPYPGEYGKFIALSMPLNITDVVITPLDQSITVLGNRLGYSVIDMTALGGMGAVTVKNVLLTGAMGVLGESVAAVRKTNDNGYWIIAVGKGNGANSSLNVWEVTSSGVQTACIASYPLPQNTNGTVTAIANGYLRFSVDGKYFAWPEYTGTGNALFFGEFDPATGTFPTIKVMNTGYRGYGVEFNHSGKILYAGSWEQGNTNLYAYKFEDLLASPNPGTVSRRTVATGIAGGTSSLQALQLGPDGRIYSPVGGTTSMLVIDDINDYDNFTTHVVNGLLPTGSANYMAVSGLPNFMAHYFVPLQAGSIAGNQTVCSGSAVTTLTSTAVASGGDGTYTYRWQLSTDGVSWYDITGSAGSGVTYSPGVLTATTHYRRNASGTYEGTPATATSNVVTVTVTPNASPSMMIITD